MIRIVSMVLNHITLSKQATRISDKTDSYGEHIWSPDHITLRPLWVEPRRAQYPNRT